MNNFFNLKIKNWKLKESYKLCHSDVLNYVYSVLEMILEIPHYESVLLSLYCYYYDTSYSKHSS